MRNSGHSFQETLYVDGHTIKVGARGSSVQAAEWHCGFRTVIVGQTRWLATFT